MGARGNKPGRGLKKASGRYGERGSWGVLSHPAKNNEGAPQPNVKGCDVEREARKRDLLNEASSKRPRKFSPAQRPRQAWAPSAQRSTSSVWVEGYLTSPPHHITIFILFFILYFTYVGKIWGRLFWAWEIIIELEINILDSDLIRVPGYAVVKL